MKALLALILKFSGLFGLDKEATLIQDGEATAANPSDANITQDIQDAGIVFEKYFPNVPVAKVQAVENVLTAAVPLKDARSTANLETFGTALVVNAPAFGLKDAPLTADVQAQLASCNSTLQALAIVVKAALAVEGVS
jgi:hypothetical protein